MHWKLWPYYSWVRTQIDSRHQPESFNSWFHDLSHFQTPLGVLKVGGWIFHLKIWRRKLPFLQHYKAIVYWLVILISPISIFKKLKYLKHWGGIIGQLKKNGSESFGRHVTAIILLRNGYLYNHKHIYAISTGGKRDIFLH